MNRIIRWTATGIEYEADPRQVEKLVEALDLKGANSVVPPGLKPLPEQLEADKPLSQGEHTNFRGLAARGNYLSADRPRFSMLRRRAVGGWPTPQTSARQR